jgi:hypothetical protein
MSSSSGAARLRPERLTDVLAAGAFAPRSVLRAEGGASAEVDALDAAGVPASSAGAATRGAALGQRVVGGAAPDASVAC